MAEAALTVGTVMQNYSQRMPGFEVILAHHGNLYDVILHNALHTYVHAHDRTHTHTHTSGLYKG